MFGAAVTSLIMGGFVVVSRFGVSNLTSAADLTFFRYLSGLILLPVFLKRPILNLGGNWLGSWNCHHDTGRMVF